MLETNLLQRFSETDEFRDLERTTPAAPARRHGRRRTITNSNGADPGGSGSDGNANGSALPAATTTSTSIAINESSDNDESIANSGGHSSAAVADDLENGVVAVGSSGSGGADGGVHDDPVADAVAELELEVEGESKSEVPWGGFPSQDSQLPWIPLGDGDAGEQGAGETREDVDQEEEVAWTWNGERAPVAAV